MLLLFNNIIPQNHKKIYAKTKTKRVKKTTVETMFCDIIQFFTIASTFYIYRSQKRQNYKKNIAKIGNFRQKKQKNNLLFCKLFLIFLVFFIINNKNI